MLFAGRKKTVPEVPSMARGHKVTMTVFWKVFLELIILTCFATGDVDSFCFLRYSIHVGVVFERVVFGSKEN